jgi:hypothetical protein
VPASVSSTPDRAGRICSFTVAYGEVIVLVEDWTDDMNGLPDSDERTLGIRPPSQSAMKGGNEGQFSF